MKRLMLFVGAFTLCLSYAAAQTFTDDGFVSHTSDQIGIGTSFPNHDFQVVGAVQFGEQNTHSGIGGSNGARLGIRHSVTNGYAPMILMVHSGIRTWDMGVHYDQSFRIRDFDGNSFRFTILNNGNTGIGTASPEGKLHVRNHNLGSQHYLLYANIFEASEARMQIMSSDKDNAASMIFLTNVPEAGGDNKHWSIHHTGVGRGDRLDIGYGTSSVSGDANMWNLTPKMVIKTDGSVGVGLSDPSEKLEVNGTIRSKEVKVEAAPWPDYVFAPEYELQSLEETETYIKENHRLPDMPSAEEVAEHGIELGEMNRLVVKRLEEVTLHLIELEKENEQLKSELSQQLKANTGEDGGVDTAYNRIRKTSKQIGK